MSASVAHRKKNRQQGRGQSLEIVSDDVLKAVARGAEMKCYGSS